ncbi:hypothetical protein BKA56DRAFT_81229 [Ilyonectria sp. MPI-CAGE-AT-0026]|nr:hypothetical protein BKA56DRAFT_81229 [Ilyonectria sp. MPI-CAGE-AT-0026]
MRPRTSAKPIPKQYRDSDRLSPRPEPNIRPMILRVNLVHPRPPLANLHGKYRIQSWRHQQ